MPTALVIDDDVQVRNLTSLILRRAGYDVREANDGKEGLEACRTQMPDIVVTDVFMPHQDGIDVLREVKSLANPPRVVMISGGSPRMQLDFLEIGKKLGADSIVHKPFTHEQLMQAVRG